jgi:hypothetical protein
MVNVLGAADEVRDTTETEATAEDSSQTARKKLALVSCAHQEKALTEWYHRSGE